MLCALPWGVSTREYREVLPQMAATAGVLRSAISRQAAEHHILSAVAVDTESREPIVGIEQPPRRTLPRSGACQPGKASP